MSRTIWIVILSGGLILAVSMGLRQSLGLFIEPMSQDLGWSIGVFALALAIQNLLWGAAQPFMGALADKYGPVPVLIGGSIIYGVGLLWMAFPTSEISFNISSGFVLGLGISALGIPIVLGAVAQMVSDEQRSRALGIVAMGGSFGQFVFAPLSQWLITGFGWSMALIVLGIIAALSCILALKVAPKKVNVASASTNAPVSEQTLKEALHEAFGQNSYLLLNLGFFVCGFHIAFIATHMPMYLATCNISPEVGATALSVIGLANMVGTYYAGVMGGKFPKKYLLSLIYISRSVAILLYVLIPVSVFTTIVFAIVMGLLWLSTVPLTSGLVGVMFGTRYMTTLFAITLFTHQIGAFFGAWLGGYLFDLTGSFDGAWLASIALGVFSAIVHLPIKERSLKTQAA